MANSSDSDTEQIRQEEPTKDAAATAKADHEEVPSKKDDSSVNSSQLPMGPDIKKDGSMPRW